MNADRQRATYYDRKRHGQCVRCGRSAVPGKTLCKRHQQHRYAYLAARYRAMRDAYVAQNSPKA
ncbi:MAG: hypothetical protein OEW98_00215 [Betaproteobacteria bacterium]|nr:hypothetical protein [Betaproteobacteria bacterium]